MYVRVNDGGSTPTCFDLNRSSFEDDLLRSKHVGVPLNIFMYFNEISTLD